MQNALLNVPAHDFDDLVVDRRSSKNVVTEVRDNSRPRREYYEEEDTSPRRSYYSEPEPEPVYREPEPSTYRQPEPDYTQKPEGVPDYVEPAPEPVREPEPVYHEPEPVYHEPEPIREPEPAAVIDSAPSFDDESSKGRN